MKQLLLSQSSGEMYHVLIGNGNITGYYVRYRVNGSSDPLQTILVNDPSTRQTGIPGLNSSTIYSIQIAATNSNGTGPYSDPVNQLTLGNCLIDY